MVFMGNEIYFGQDVPKLLKEKQIYTMNGRDYVLVEFSPVSEASYIRQGLQQLQMSGFNVVLAHVERYEVLYANSELLNYLFEIGILFQVNSGSIVGDNGRKSKIFVDKLLEAEIIFCVGTDAHNSKKRPPHMQKAFKEDEISIDLLELFNVLFRKLHIIIFLGITMGILAFAGTKAFRTPQYTSTTKMYVLSKQNEGSAVT